MLSISGLNLFSNKQSPQNAQIQQNSSIKLHSQPKNDTVSFGMCAKRVKMFDSKLEIVQDFLRRRLRAFNDLELVRSSNKKEKDLFFSKQSYSLPEIEEFADIVDKKIESNLSVMKTYSKEWDMPECLKKAYWFKEKSRAANNVKNNFLIEYPEKINGEWNFPKKISPDQRAIFLETGKIPFVVSTNIVNSVNSPDLVKRNLFSSAMQRRIDEKLARGKGEFVIECSGNMKFLVSTLKCPEGLGKKGLLNYNESHPIDAYSIKVID